MDHAHHAERCRSLVGRARSATLATIARDPEGYPFGSLVTIACDDRGRPILLLSTLAEHTKNLATRADASLLVHEPLGDQPLAAERVTVLGPCERIPDDEIASARALFLAAHPDAASYVELRDFAFYRLEPIGLRYVGGFGRMSWVDAAAYRAVTSSLSARGS